MKADEDAAKKKADAKRQEDLTNHLIQAINMLTQAGVQFLKDKRELGKVCKLIYISAISSSSVEVLLVEISRILMAQCDIKNGTYPINNPTEVYVSNGRREPAT